MEFILAIFGTTLDGPAFLLHCIHILAQSVQSGPRVQSSPVLR